MDLVLSRPRPFHYAVIYHILKQHLGFGGSYQESLHRVKERSRVDRAPNCVVVCDPFFRSSVVGLFGKAQASSLDLGERCSGAMRKCRKHTVTERESEDSDYFALK